MSNKIKNKITIAIENLRMWRGDNWLRYDLKSSNIQLRVQYDQLIIADNSRVLETINFIGKVKGILKDDILILIINVAGKEIRKIKFKISTNVQKHIQELNTCFPVVKYNSIAPKNKIMPKYLKISDIMKQAFEAPTSKMDMPENFTNFCKLCLIDPSFPQIVNEAEKIIREKLLENN